MATRLYLNLLPTISRKTSPEYESAGIIRPLNGSTEPFEIELVRAFVTK